MRRGLFDELRDCMGVVKKMVKMVKRKRIVDQDWRWNEDDGRCR